MQKAVTLIVVISAFGLSAPLHAQPNRYDALANSPMVENRPSVASSNRLRDELLFQRATQTYLWALPLINTLGMKFGSEKVFGEGYNVLPIWKKRRESPSTPKHIVTACADPWKHC